MMSRQDNEVLKRHNITERELINIMRNRDRGVQIKYITGVCTYNHILGIVFYSKYKGNTIYIMMIYDTKDKEILSKRDDYNYTCDRKEALNEIGKQIGNLATKLMEVA